MAMDAMPKVKLLVSSNSVSIKAGVILYSAEGVGPPAVAATMVP